jgi:TetR/AcrR family transcriptional repressor of nem operon
MDEFGSDCYLCQMGRPRKFDDDEVLDRAIDLFWRDGSAAVSIRDLETALELRAPSIYRRFESKDQLLARCLDRYVDQEVGGRIRDFLEESDDPLIGLRSFFTSVLRPHRDEQHLRGCLLTTTASHLESSTRETRQAVDQGFSAIEAAFRLQIERAMVIGQLDAGTDATATAKALLLSFQGLLVLARSGVSDLAANIDATFRTLQPR